MAGFEPAATRPPDVCATRLRYIPIEKPFTPFCLKLQAVFNPVSAFFMKCFVSLLFVIIFSIASFVFYELLDEDICTLLNMI